MPMIDITLEEGALPDRELERLTRDVARIALKYEGFEGSRYAEEVTWIYAHVLPRAHVVRADGKAVKPLYRLEFTTLQGLLDQASKQKLAAEVARAVYDLEGSTWDPREATNRVWVLYRDVREGDWIDGDVVNDIPALRANAATGHLETP